MKQRQIKHPYTPPRVECRMMEQQMWSILSSASLATDFVDYEDVGTVDEWGEATDM